MDVEDFNLPPLFRLPIEIRFKIYEYCYLPPHPHCSQPEGFCVGPPPLSGEPSKYGRHSVSQDACLLPNSHQSLLSVCRQIHAEAFPIFAERHVMSFWKPLKFANEYLSFLPPQRLTSLRHLRMSWPSLDHLLISTKPTIFGDLWNLERLWKDYPELSSNFESFVFDFPVVYATCTSKIRTLFRSARRLIEDLKSDPDRKYLLICRGPANGTAHLCIRHVAQSEWDRVINGFVLRTDKTLRFRSEKSVNACPWEETIAFTIHPSESEKGIETVPLSVQQTGKNWKIVYQLRQDDGPCWMRVLETVDIAKAAEERIKARKTLSSLRRKAILQAKNSVSPASLESPVAIVKPKKRRIVKVQKSKGRRRAKVSSA